VQSPPSFRRIQKLEPANTIQKQMNFQMSVAVIHSNPSLHVAATSDFGVSIRQVQLGQHLVTFPEGIKIAGCIATPNSGEGMITATHPQLNNTLSPNQVSVLTFDPNGAFTGAQDYTLVAFHSNT
jgi:hypothetical protein